jgi:lysophospholipase L1-like esterase
MAQARASGSGDHAPGDLRTTPALAGHNDPSVHTAAGMGAVQRMAAAPQGGVLFCGDSHTIAIANQFRAVSRDGNDVRTVYKNGTRSDQWATGGALAPLLDDALKSRPDVVILSLGTNDGIARTPAAQIQAHVLDLVKRIEAVGAKAVFALPLHTEKETAEVDASRAAIAAVLQQHPDVQVVDISGTPLPLRDGIHAHMSAGKNDPVPDGYKTWATKIYDQIENEPAMKRVDARNHR